MSGLISAASTPQDVRRQGLMRCLRMPIADDHKMGSEAFRRMLELEFDMVGAASDGREILDLALLTVADFCMPRMNGLEAERTIHHLFHG